jgi:hypothetical protein
MEVIAHHAVGHDLHPAKIAHLPKQPAQRLFLHIIKMHLPAAGA